MRPTDECDCDCRTISRLLWRVALRLPRRLWWIAARTDDLAYWFADRRL